MLLLLLFLVSLSVNLHFLNTVNKGPECVLQESFVDEKNNTFTECVSYEYFGYVFDNIYDGKYIVNNR